MKLKIFALLTLAATISASAETFKYKAAGDNQPEITYEIIEERPGEVRTAARNATIVEVEIETEEWDQELQQNVKVKKIEPTLTSLSKDNPYDYEIYNQNVKGPEANGYQSSITIPKIVYDNDNNPYTVTEIGDCSFATFGANQIILPETITKIGKGAFFRAQNLNDIVLPLSVTTIGDYCCYVTKIKSLTINEGLTSVGINAFAGCGEIVELTILGSIDQFSNQSFISSIQKVQTLTIGGSVKKIPNNIFEGFTGINTLTINDDVEEIGKAAFKNCHSLKSLSFNCKNLQIIQDEAFMIENTLESGSGASAITSISIPAKVHTLGESAFEGFTGIKKIEFSGDLITVIKKRAFFNCRSLETLKIPDSVLKIEDEAFYFCDNLANLTLGDNVNHIGNYAFYHCQKLQCIIIPDSVIHIGNYAFYLINISQRYQEDCFHMGNSLEWIGDFAFFNFKATQLKFPSTLKHVGKQAFDAQANHTTKLDFIDDGEHLCNIYIDAVYPPECPMDAFGSFNDTNYARGHWIYYCVCLHVPQGTYNLYKSPTIERDGEVVNNGWSQFQCIVEDLVDKSAPIAAIVDYTFVRPGDEIKLNEIVLPKLESSANTEKNIELEWRVYKKPDYDTEATLFDESTPVSRKEGTSNTTDLKTKKIYDGLVTLYADGHGVANNFGEVIALAYRDYGNKRTDVEGNKNETAVEQTLAAAVAVFVCPTITVVYNTTVPPRSDEAGEPEQQNLNRDLVKLLEDETEESGETDALTKKDLISTVASYEHRVVYNSVPKVQVTTPSTNLNITKIERGEADKAGNLAKLDSTDGTDSKYLEDITDSKTSDNNLGEGYIVPIDPITNDRVLQISTNMSLTSEGGGLVGVTDVEVSDNITVHVQGNVMTIVGADDNDIVTIVDLNGRTVYRGTEKTVRLGQTGVYIATVADAAFKILAR